MNDPLLVIVVGLAVLALLVALLGYVAYRGMIHYRMRDEAYQRQAGLEAGDFDPASLELPWIEEDVASPGGYPLRIHALAAPSSGAFHQGKLAVFHHGIGWGWLGMIRYMELFRAEGWAVVAYDSRGHGPRQNGRPARPSYGYYEKDDLKAVADWALARFPHGDGYIVFGESMGAATALQYAAIDPRLDAAIADCPYSSAMEELEYRLKSVMVPPGLRSLVVLVADAFCRRFELFSLREADPARAILETEIPLLFIHGLDDRYVPWRMSVVMAETRRRRLPGAVTELLLMPDAKHAQSIRADKKRYTEALHEFLESALAKR